MHARLHRDVWVCDARREQLAQRAKVEGVGGRDAAALRKTVFELLEYGVLQDGVDDEDKRGHDAGEKAGRTLVLEQREQRAERRRRFCGLRARQRGLVAVRLTRRHARVDDPDRVRDEDRCGARKGACHHRLDGCEFLGGAAGLERRFLEEGTRPFVPVVIDKVCDANAEEGGLEACVEPGDALALDDAAGSIEGRRLRTLRFDLGACGERDQGVPVPCISE